MSGEKYGRVMNAKLIDALAELPTTVNLLGVITNAIGRRAADEPDPTVRDRLSVVSAAAFELYCELGGELDSIVVGHAVVAAAKPAAHAFESSVWNAQIRRVLAVGRRIDELVRFGKPQAPRVVTR